MNLVCVPDESSEKRMCKERGVRGGELDGDLLFGFRTIVFFPDGAEIVGRIKLCAESSPGSFLKGHVDFPEAMGRNSKGDDVPNTHRDIPGHDFDSFGRKVLPKGRFLELCPDLFQVFRLVMFQKDGQEEGFSLCRESFFADRV